MNKYKITKDAHIQYFNKYLKYLLTSVNLGSDDWRCQSEVIGNVENMFANCHLYSNIKLISQPVCIAVINKNICYSLQYS